MRWKEGTGLVGWDPELQQEVPILGEVTPCENPRPERTVPRLLDARQMDWLGRPMTKTEAEDYEKRRNKILGQ